MDEHEALKHSQAERIQHACSVADLHSDCDCCCQRWRRCLQRIGDSAEAEQRAQERLQEETPLLAPADAFACPCAVRGTQSDTPDALVHRSPPPTLTPP
jgi:hypothetical protein